MNPRFAWVSLFALFFSSCASPKAELWQAWKAARPVSKQSDHLREASFEGLPAMGKQTAPPSVSGPFFRSVDGRNLSFFNVGFGYCYIADLDQAGYPRRGGFFTDEGKAVENPFP